MSIEDQVRGFVVGLNTRNPELDGKLLKGIVKLIAQVNTVLVLEEPPRPVAPTPEPKRASRSKVVKKK